MELAEKRFQDKIGLDQPARVAKTLGPVAAAKIGHHARPDAGILDRHAVEPDMAGEQGQEMKAETDLPGIDNRLLRIVRAQPHVRDLERDQAGAVERDAGLSDLGIDIDADERGESVLGRLAQPFAAELRGAEKVERNKGQDGEDGDNAEADCQPPEKAAQPKAPPQPGKAASVPGQCRRAVRNQRPQSGGLAAPEAYLLVFRYFRMHPLSRRKGPEWTNLASVLYGSPANGSKNRRHRAKP